MALLYFKNPSPPNEWVPFGTSDPVADEVQVVPGVPPTDPLVELWIDPDGTGTDADWPAYDARYVALTGSTMTGPLNLPAGDPPTSQAAASKDYVDRNVMMVSRATLQAHMPVGSITMFAGKRVPLGWYLCDGKPHGSWALQEALDSENTPVIPPSRHCRFIIYGGA